MIKKKLYKLILPLVVLLLSIAFGGKIYASEITGTLSTGLRANNRDVIEGIVVKPPIANPVPGVYTSVQNVTLAGSEGTMNIHYTTNGIAPTCQTGLVYSTPITISNAEETIEAVSCYPNSITSAVAVLLYAINTPPSSAPTGGGGGGGGGGTTTFSSSNPGISADANKDGKVDILDFVILMANWGKAETGNQADFNGDGKTDILDFVILMANWTK